MGFGGWNLEVWVSNILKEQRPLPELHHLAEGFGVCINVQRFRGGLVFKAHRLLYHLNSRLESNQEEEEFGVWRQDSKFHTSDKTVNSIEFFFALT